MIRILQTDQVGRLLARRGARLAEAEAVVRPILEDVRKRGDRALMEYARKFDRLQRKSVRVPERELSSAAGRLAPEFCAAVKTAAANIRAYAERQMPRAWMRDFRPGLRLGQMVRPLDTIAAYIPSGRYPLPSTILMTVVPAQVAGVPNICVATPRAVNEVFGTASLLGVSRVFEMGGAQAIAALAFGTRTVPRADRIVGPGNIYVAAAKKLLAGEVGIDFVAGPTEILIIASEGDPRHLAADMLAQAEHDVDASAVLLTTSKRLASAVAKEVDRQLAVLPTAGVAAKAIARNSAIVLVRSLAEALEISNRFAPEHLSIPEESLLAGVRHAGSVFVGPFSPEAAGDYASGPNHVLPTSGAARVRGGLSVTDYLKVISVQQLSEPALRKLAPAITTLARAEGLEAHARSVEARTSGSQTVTRRSATASPRSATATARSATANPRSHSAPPRSHTPPPRSDSATLRFDSAAPRSDAASPRYDSVAPRSATATQRSDTVTPRSQTASPRSATATPRSQTASPRSATASPRSDSATPRSDAATPRSDAANPRSATTTARSQTATARSDTASPRSDTASPRSDTATPRSATATPRSNAATARSAAATTRYRAATKGSGARPTGEKS